jgi:hypothetical protein
MNLATGYMYLVPITGSGLPVLTYHWMWYGTVEICTSAVESCLISGKGRRVSLLHTS